MTFTVSIRLISWPISAWVAGLIFLSIGPRILSAALLLAGAILDSEHILGLARKPPTRKVGLCRLVIRCSSFLSMSRCHWVSGRRSRCIPRVTRRSRSLDACSIKTRWRLVHRNPRFPTRELDSLGLYLISQDVTAVVHPGLCWEAGCERAQGLAPPLGARL